MTQQLIERHAARAVVWTPQGEVLVLIGSDPALPEPTRYVWTPGGGIDDGEEQSDAVIRELWEEVGFEVSRSDLGPLVLHRIGEFSFDGRPLRQIESYFSIPVAETFEPRALGWEDLEVRSIAETVWRTTAELRSGPEPFFPRCLADLVDYLVESGPPAEPWSEEQGFGET